VAEKEFFPREERVQVAAKAFFPELKAFKSRRNASSQE
jgi:hypothetical protein